MAHATAVAPRPANRPRNILPEPQPLPHTLPGTTAHRCNARHNDTYIGISTPAVRGSAARQSEGIAPGRGEPQPPISSRRKGRTSGRTRERGRRCRGGLLSRQPLLFGDPFCDGCATFAIAGRVAVAVFAGNLTVGNPHVFPFDDEKYRLFSDSFY